MPTWMTHFRVADELLNRINGLSAGEFIVGNIGPDCGEPNEDWTVFTPPKHVTHWRDEHWNIRAEDYFEAHVDTDDPNTQRFSFHLGYYIHLLTDIEWTNRVFEPKMKQYKARLDSDNEFNRKFKRDWYDCDHIFYRENPDFRAFCLFSGMKGYSNDYLDYFPEGAIRKQTERIISYYLNPPEGIDHEYTYLSVSEITDFVRTATDSISDMLARNRITSVKGA